MRLRTNRTAVNNQDAETAAAQKPVRSARLKTKPTYDESSHEEAEDKQIENTVDSGVVNADQSVTEVSSEQQQDQSVQSVDLNDLFPMPQGLPTSTIPPAHTGMHQQAPQLLPLISTVSTVPPPMTHQSVNHQAMAHQAYAVAPHVQHMQHVQADPSAGNDADKYKPPKKYACELCTKRFSRPSSLKTHMHSHTGERPFECTLPGCGRRFSVLSNLRRHMKICATKGKPATTLAPGQAFVGNPAVYSTQAYAAPPTYAYAPPSTTTASYMPQGQYYYVQPQQNYQYPQGTQGYPRLAPVPVNMPYVYPPQDFQQAENGENGEAAEAAEATTETQQDGENTEQTEDMENNAEGEAIAEGEGDAETTEGGEQ